MNWKRKLTSRKLWLSVAAFVSGVMVYLGAEADEAAKVAALILQGAAVLAYCIGEGLADSNPSDGIEFLWLDEEE